MGFDDFEINILNSHGNIISNISQTYLDKNSVIFLPITGKKPDVNGDFFL